MVANGGTSALALFWSGETTWHEAHHLLARSRPCSASAEKAATVERDRATAANEIDLTTCMNNLSHLDDSLQSASDRAPAAATAYGNDAGGSLRQPRFLWISATVVAAAHTPAKSAQRQKKHLDRHTKEPRAVHGPGVSQVVASACRLF
jgi:hypothetical protein